MFRYTFSKIIISSKFLIKLYYVKRYNKFVNRFKIYKNSLKTCITEKKLFTYLSLSHVSKNHNEKHDAIFVTLLGSMECIFASFCEAFSETIRFKACKYFSS